MLAIERPGSSADFAIGPLANSARESIVLSATLPSTDDPQRVLPMLRGEIREWLRSWAATERRDQAGLVADALRMFTLAVATGRLALRPTFPTIEVRSVRPGFFEASELRRVVANLPAHLVPVVLFGYFTWWRKSELLGLRWHQIDFAVGTVRLEPGTTKNDEGRMFPFGEFPEPRDLRQAMQQLATARTGTLTGTIARAGRGKWAG